ncbi:MAG: exopolyphosphatase [Lentimicrobiaceae bacterium]|nr:exopolyphosphatase [Lentimicrobiaceae bacterium]MCB9024400.1 exopolyphosphatase [Lentimicrobiaceae bacterium]MCO5265652.1 Ppx/GppA family phosphatase [Lentimicrobium sp.]
MLFSSIDIGSNAVRLLFANVYDSKGGPVTEKASLIRIPIRLGMDVFNIGRISDPKADDLVKTMQAFRLLIDVYKPISYLAAATSAMREAENNKEVLERVKNETGLKLSMIDGIQEANIISSLSNVFVNKNFSKTIYIDVGGGSTEISVLDGEKFITSNSFKIGTIRLLADKVEDAEWEAMRKWLNQFKADFGRMNCIGSGGNINKITKLYGYPINNMINFDQLQYAYKQLNSMPLDVRIERMGLRPDRADVIVPAARIFIRILKWTGINIIIAPKIGLADGLVLLQYKEMKENGLI